MENDFYEQTACFMLKKTPLIIYDNFICAVRRDMRLTEFDEKIYDYYEKVVGYFIKAEEIYSENIEKIKTKAVIKLLSGLMSVLKSRVSFFDETLSKYEHLNLLGEKINPIYVEKRNIIELVKKDIKAKTDKEARKCADLMSRELSGAEAADEYTEFYNKAVLGEIIKLNDTIVKFYVNLMNDIERRTVVSDFYEMLKDEAQVLGSVIKVQASELEKANQTDEEENIIQMILFQLREAYQYCTSYVDSIENKFGAVKSRSPIAFHSDINKFYINAGELNEWIRENKNIKINAAVNIAKGLTESIVNSFKNILRAEKNIDNDEKRIKDIIKGIDETIKIKADSIEESFKGLEEAAENESFTDERAEKEVDLYLRQTLLFELTTFEEIMTYSVSKLREAESQSIKAYVGAIDREIKSIEKCLEENGIEDINPLPKTQFNGREHDVLMAEKADGFKKGEIIKVLTRGYKKKNTVYIRASVIAAK